MNLKLSNKVYDALKALAQVILPAVAAAYFALARIWNLPSAEQVVGTITVLDTLLGTCLGLSSKQYNNSDAAYDGNVVISHDEQGKKKLSLDLTSDPTGKDKLALKVQPPPT